MFNNIISGMHRDLSDKIIFEFLPNYSETPYEKVREFYNIGKIKLDIEKFKSDMDSKVVKNKVQADLASGNKAEINSTPTFFLNGNKIELTTLDEFKKLLLK